MLGREEARMSNGRRNNYDSLNPERKSDFFLYFLSNNVFPLSRILRANLAEAGCL